MMQIPIESVNFMMLNVGFAQHNADWNWKHITSPFTRIYLVTEGSATLRLMNVNDSLVSKVRLVPQHLYIIPANTYHSYECDGKFSHYYLHVCEGFKKETDVFEFYDFPSDVVASVFDEQIFAKMCEHHPEALLPASDPTSYDNRTYFYSYVHRYNQLPLYEKMNLRGSILLLFSRFLQYATPKLWTSDERMSKILSYINNNIYNSISVAELASVACVTKAYLIRVFGETFGISPLQYINKKKIEKAQLLLITERMQVGEIAYSLSFNDFSYFIRLFKKTTGLTPNEYRKSMNV